MGLREVEPSLADVYEQDETAWLEAMARLVAERRYGELDHVHLSEFLADMARRDKRELLRRLATLLAHFLKWQHQPDQRTSSWRATVAAQGEELADLLESRTLLNYAQEVLAKAYGRAVRQALLETGIPESDFPAECPWTSNDVLGQE